jgi:hypothetical protein
VDRVWILPIFASSTGVSLVVSICAASEVHIGVARWNFVKADG